jgi:hypothetical protein
MVPSCDRNHGTNEGDASLIIHLRGSPSRYGAANRQKQVS